MFLLPRTASPIPEFLYAENPDFHNFCGFLYRDYQSSPSDNPFPLSLSQSYLLSDILFVSLFAVPANKVAGATATVAAAAPETKPLATPEY